jgi:hypothetical protein
LALGVDRAEAGVGGGATVPFNADSSCDGKFAKSSFPGVAGVLLLLPPASSPCASSSPSSSDRSSSSHESATGCFAFDLDFPSFLLSELIDNLDNCSAASAFSVEGVMVSFVLCGVYARKLGNVCRVMTIPTAALSLVLSMVALKDTVD